MTMTNILHEIFLSGISSIVLVLALLTMSTCGELDTFQSDAVEEGNFKDPLGRLLVARFASSTRTDPRLLRTLADGGENSRKTLKTEFGPGANWSCTTPENDDYDACTLSATGCSWCPLGSSTGVCLRNSQADLVNALENDHLLHLKCYGNEDQVIDESATEFWDEAASCLPHEAGDCHGEHGDGDHTCTWCTIDEPAMGLCFSQSLWDNMVVAQALEEFDEDVSTGNQVRLDQVIHCHQGDGDNKSKSSGSIANTNTNTWSQQCGWTTIETDVDAANCLSIEGETCVIQTNPFPGLLGSKAGGHCVSLQQQHVMLWAIALLRDMGWQDEMSSFQ